MDIFSKVDAQWLITKIKSALSGKVDKVDGKGLSANDYTTDEKNKLSGIAAGANNYTHPAHTAAAAGLYKVTVDALGHVTAATKVAKADITGLGIPAQDTTYGDATTSASGLATAAMVTKLNGVAAGAQVNVLESVKVNGTAQTIRGKAVNITVPTKVSALNNDSGFQTAAQVSSAIASAVSGITGFDFQVVTSLPTTGAKGIIYLVAHAHSDSGDSYDEYIWLTDKKAYEKIGNTDVDLSAYAKTADFNEIGTDELQAMWNA